MKGAMCTTLALLATGCVQWGDLQRAALAPSNFRDGCSIAPLAPHRVSILLNSRDGQIAHCSGRVIDHLHIQTVSHCVETLSASWLKVEHLGRQYPVVDIVSDPRLAGTPQGDLGIATLTLSSPLLGFESEGGRATPERVTTGFVLVRHGEQFHCIPGRVELLNIEDFAVVSFRVAEVERASVFNQTPASLEILLPGDSGSPIFVLNSSHEPSSVGLVSVGRTFLFDTGGYAGAVGPRT